jgi:hypothetical protein
LALAFRGSVFQLVSLFFCGKGTSRSFRCDAPVCRCRSQINLEKRSKPNSAARPHVLGWGWNLPQFDSLRASARPELPFWCRKQSNRGAEAAPANGQHKPMATV